MHMALESRDASTTSKLMAMGTKASVPDFLMPIVPFVFSSHNCSSPLKAR